MTVITARRILVEGIVQGVGFRPFVYTLAARHGLAGWVRNTASGVEIEVEGRPAALDAFIERPRRRALRHSPTSTAFTRRSGRQRGLDAFEIQRVRRG